MCRLIDKQTLLWRLSENKNMYYNECTYSRDIRSGTHSINMCQVRWQIWCKLKSVVVPGRVSPMRIGKAPMFSYVVCVGEHGEGCHVVSSLSPYIQDNFTHIRSRHAALFTIPWLVFWCFYFLNKYWLTPIRQVLIVAAYLVIVKINL